MGSLKVSGMKSLGKEEIQDKKVSVEIGGILAEPCNTLMICSGFDSLWRQKYWVLCFSFISRSKDYSKILRISEGSYGLC